MLQTIHIDELTTGMFVNSVVEQSGGLKIKTKGLVKSVGTIDSLKSKGVSRIEIDLSKSHIVSVVNSSADDGHSDRETGQAPANKAPQSEHEQLENAVKLYDQAKNIQSRFFKRIRANDTPSLDGTKELSRNISNAVLGMPSALSCLAMLNKSGQYQLEHSLNCSILLTLFAKHLDFPVKEIEELALAGLLMDVGMVNMPSELVNSANKLTASEKEIITTHVDIGLDLVERSGEVSQTVHDIIFNHHERVDGSGYPDRQTAADVSKPVRMAAIVDSYDAMTTQRPFQKAVPATNAMRSMLMDKAYDQQLVQQFIQCMGVHPVGSLVKLTNDRLAIVIRSNKRSPLTPTVITFYHLKTGHYTENKQLDLSKTDVQIDRSIRPEEFDINLPKFFRDVLLPQL